jgi:hypothetical protein
MGNANGQSDWQRFCKTLWQIAACDIRASSARFKPQTIVRQPDNSHIIGTKEAKMTQEFLTTAFGWMTVLNIAVLLFSTLMILIMQDWIAGIHGRMFQMERADVKKAYFRYLANYKILIIVFCLMPWLALHLA